MDYKTNNKQVYDENAQEFEERTKDYITTYILEDAELFITSLSGKRILDLGSGPGRDSIFFKNRGLNPLCLDISPEMIKLCEQKELEAIVGDLENIPFSKESFDGVWAYASILHVPKDKISQVIIKVNQILRSNGIFYCGMKEGDFEGFIESDKYHGSKRFCSLYRDEDIRKILTSQFDIFHTSRVQSRDDVYLNYLCKKKSL